MYFIIIYINERKKDLYLILVLRKMKRDIKSVVFIISLIAFLCNARYEFSIKRNWISFLEIFNIADSTFRAKMD